MISFFACELEQTAWLTAELADSTIWCVADSVKPGGMSAMRVESSDVGELIRHSRPDDLRFFLGRTDFAAEPVWRTAGARRELDVIRSRVIQLVPSLSIGDLMIEGSLGIPGLADYQEADIDFLSTKDWYSIVRRRLESAFETGPVAVTTRDSSGRLARSPRKVLFSKGAMEWHRAGRSFRQFAEANVELMPA